MTTLTSVILAVFSAAAPKPAASPKIPAPIRSEFIFPPAAKPTPSCHASTIAETPNGEFVVAWFGGSGEGNKDVGIWMSRRQNGSWSVPVEVVHGAGPGGGRVPCWNPVLHQPTAGPLLLFYKIGPNPRSWRGFLTESRDGGRTWASAVPLPEGILGPIKNKPVALRGGELLCGSSTENGGWRVHFERTPDLGRNWFRTSDLDNGKEVAAIQPAILVHADGRLQALGRSRQARVWESWSSDGGRTWSALTLTDLPNPDSGLDAVTLHDGRHILVYNPSAKSRTPLALAVSTDGRVWTRVRTLEDGQGEFSYPAVIQSTDGMIHVTYTWKRESIQHAVLDPADLVPEREAAAADYRPRRPR